MYRTAEPPRQRMKHTAKDDSGLHCEWEKVKGLTCPSTIHLEMDVFPSSPARNFKVADRGLILEITRFEGGPGSSGFRKQHY